MFNMLKQSGKSCQEAMGPVHRSSGEVLSRTQWDHRLQLSTDPNSPFFENFRRLRSTILYSRGEGQPRTILITSAEPHEGKGFVCANLGIALSQGMEHHALMVDCDFRQSTLAEMFGLSNEAGLADYLQDDSEISGLIRKTGQPKLSLIPSGKPPGNPAELLGSSRMLSLVDELAHRYRDRIILFDSPPHNIASETSVLARYLDGVVLVIRHGASKKEHVKQFVDTIGANKVFGVVFNACPIRKESILYKKFSRNYG